MPQGAAERITADAEEECRPRGASLEESLPSTSVHDESFDFQQVVLRAEVLSKAEAKALVSFTRTYLVFGVAALAVDLGFKGGEPDNFLLTHSHVETWNLVYGGVCLLPLLYGLGLFTARLHSVRRRHMQWTRRRKGITILGYSVGMFQTLNVVIWIAVNVYVLSEDCAWFHAAVIACTIVQWTMYNSMFLAFCIQAHNVMPLMDTEGNPEEGDLSKADLEPCVGDQGWLVHAPKLALWVGCEALLIAIGVYVPDSHDVGLKLPRGPDPHCAVFTPDCRLDTVSQGLTSTVLAIFLLYVALWGFYIARGQAKLRRRSYQKNRHLYVSLRVQKRTRAWSFGLFVVAVVLVFYWRPGACSSYLMNWLGLAPAQFVFTGLAVNSSLWLMPHHPASKKPVLQEWLEVFSWTEADRERCMKLRNAYSPDSTALAAEPCFCFETACKLFYWSCLTYFYKEDEEMVEEEAPAEYNLKTALHMYDLDRYHALLEPKMDTKVLLAWSVQGRVSRILCAFRGTNSLLNLKTDLQMWTSNLGEAAASNAHSPMKYNFLKWLGHSKQAVHSGFLKSWQMNGLKDRVMSMVLDLIKGYNGPVEVMFTGHSLGGALATLAAYDMAKQVDCARVHICCYSYGAPRTGNHTFAAAYQETVPDSWDLINDQDLISRNGKWLTLYKRPGKRVIINKHGDLIVRPSFVEASYQRTQLGSSINNHMLAAYQSSLAQCCAAQFQGKGFPGGDKKIVGLLAKGALQRALGPFTESIARQRPRTIDRGSLNVHNDALQHLQTHEDEEPEEHRRKLVLLQELSPRDTEVSSLHEACGRVADPDTAEAQRSSVEEDRQ